MSIFIDIKYLNQIGGRLPLFKKKGNYTWNCRCTICGDSQTKKNKARGYFFRKANDLFYKCHNCDASQHFGTFLKHFDSNLYREYVLERYVNGENRRAHSNPEESFKKMMEVPNFKETEEDSNLLDMMMPRLSDLSKDHEARVYCAERLIPEDQLNRLYYIDDMKKIGQISEKMRDKIVTSEPRLVIPFRDQQGKLIGMTCRGMRGEALRYIMVRIDEDAPQIFGLDAIDTRKHVYVVEGPLDSLFLPNAIAVGGTGFTKLTQVNLTRSNVTVVIDNQPRNKEVCGIYRKMIDAGYNIVIWPTSVAGKDINQLVMDGMELPKVKELIDKNTYNGPRAMFEFNLWRKV